MYRLIILPNALVDLSKLDKAIAQRIVNKLTWLSENVETITPLPLRGSFSGFYKLRVGDWLVIYGINHNNMTITVHKIGLMKDIYQ